MSKPVILVVEDDSDLSEIMLKKLTDSNLQPVGVATGREALDYLVKYKPDLILLDILLPDIDGVSVLNELVHSPKTRDLPVIIYSNMADEGSVEQVAAVGKYDYFVKSKTDLNELVKAIKTKLKIN